MFDRKECKARAREALKGKYTGAVKIGLINMVAIMAFYFVYFCMVISLVRDPELAANNVQQISRLMGIVMLFVLMFPVFILAYKKSICDLLKGKEISPRTFFQDFKYIGQAEGLFWWTYLMIIIRALIFVAVFIVVAIFAAVFGRSEGGRIVLLIIMAAAYIAMYVYMFSLMYRYSMNWYIVANNPKIECIPATKYSVLITKKHRFDLFVMDLSFLGWFLLAWVTAGIYNLWLMPYYEASRFYALEQLSSEANDEKTKIGPQKIESLPEDSESASASETPAEPQN